MHLVSTGCDDAIMLEALQARREHTGREARECGLEILKAARVVSKEIAQDQDGPSVPDDIQCACNRAFEVLLPGHRISFQAAALFPGCHA